MTDGLHRPLGRAPKHAYFVFAASVLVGSAFAATCMLVARGETAKSAPAEVAVPGRAPAGPPPGTSPRPSAKPSNDDDKERRKQERREERREEQKRNKKR